MSSDDDQRVELNDADREHWRGMVSTEGNVWSRAVEGYERGNLESCNQSFLHRLIESIKSYSATNFVNKRAYELWCNAHPNITALSWDYFQKYYLKLYNSKRQGNLELWDLAFDQQLTACRIVRSNNPRGGNAQPRARGEGGGGGRNENQQVDMKLCDTSTTVVNYVPPDIKTSPNSIQTNLDLQKTLKYKEDEINALQTTCDDLIEECEHLLSDFEELKKTNTKLVKAFLKEKSHKENLASEIEKLKKELKKKTRELLEENQEIPLKRKISFVIDDDEERKSKRTRNSTKMGN